jgi:CheY-like chemotaxis protein
MKMLQLPISLNNLNHELRTPLTAILGIATLLNKGDFTSDQKLYLEDLETSAYSLLGLADKLSSLAKEIDVKEKTIQNTTDSSIELDSNVLLVEDTPILQVVHTKMLERLGLHVELAETGEEALKKMNKSTYKLIFMDVGLPGMSGIEAAAEIRRLPSEKKHTPIIALTGFADQKTKQACLDAGINLVANKPIKQKKLSKLVSYYC